ncbi:MAG: thioredoxin family protein [Thermoguttaceae bacterium]|jgi:thiol-disulfide isomerase/thioredoxin|nr:thioredoxin family protein [Thermoguttaceae bacterium]
MRIIWMVLGALFVASVLIVAAIASIHSCIVRPKGGSEGTVRSYSDAAPLELTNLTTDEEFDAFVKGSKIAVVKFSASWCGPCKRLTPELQKMAGFYADDGVAIGEVDVDANGPLSDKYKVKSIPRTFVFVNGQVYGDIVGSRAHAINKLIGKACRERPTVETAEEVVEEVVESSEAVEAVIEEGAEGSETVEEAVESSETVEVVVEEGTAEEPAPETPAE